MPTPSDSSFREWVHRAQELFYQIDMEGRFLYVNPAWEKATGFGRDELVGRYFFDFQPPETKARDLAVMAEVMSKPHFSQHESAILHKDGNVIQAVFSGVQILDVEGKPVCIQGFGFDITALKMAEESARRHAEQMRTFITNAPMAIAMFDKELRYLAYSDRWLEDYGLAGQNLLGRHHYDVFPSIRDHQTWPDVHRRALAGESFRKDEDRFIGPNGQQEWLRWDVRPWFESSGEIGGILMLTESTTARRRAEMELRHSEERYRNLVDMGFEAIFIHENGILVDANRTLVDMIGYASREEIIGKNGIDLVLEPESKDAILARLRSGETQPAPCWCRRKDGVRFIAEIQSRNITYLERPMRLVTIRDVTEQKKAEEALAAEKERLSVTLHSIGDGVIATDTQGRIVIMNVVAEAMTGWSQVDAKGRSLSEVFHIVHEVTRAPMENPVDKVLATGDIIELANHTVLLARDGTERTIADSGAPIRGGDGKTMGVVLVFRDTTEKQRLIQAAQRAQKLESLGILAGGIAHDFNNLLGGIFGYLELIQAKFGDENLAGYLSKAVSTIERARGLTQQLLTFAKGGLPVRKPQSLTPFIQDTVQFVLSGTAVTSKFAIAPDLKPCDIDRSQIGQVLDNLTINAQQAMPMGGTLHVTAVNSRLRPNQIGGLPEGDYVHLSLSDSGIGISPENLSRIFDPFFTTKPKGSGLGLATAFSIVRQHDGCIEVESALGRGTTFHLYLPVSRWELAEPAPEIRTAFRGSGRFAIMDDEPVIRETISEMLKLAGFEVVAFAEGRALMDYLKSHRHSEGDLTAVMVDLTIPGGMGGREVIGEIRHWHGSVPIFVSSGYADDPIMAHPEKFGITASLGKPFLRADLFAMLQKHLPRNRKEASGLPA
jgi:PAS domain S-box-containing protein